MTEATVWAGLGAMALSAFTAASPLPFQSEPVFLGLLATDTVPLWPLLITASLANTAGSMLTHAIGRAAGAGGSRWLPLSDRRRARAEAWFARWGRWSLLLSWAPGGDILVALSGLARLPVLQTLALVALAKTARYAALAGLARLVTG
ncbi:MAG: DedA family protein [Rhodobacteraceae bacterium]|nr:DedA family protein [Paracoccaceae bacterium]